MPSPRRASGPSARAPCIPSVRTTQAFASRGHQASSPQRSRRLHISKRPRRLGTRCASRWNLEGRVKQKGGVLPLRGARKHAERTRSAHALSHTHSQRRARRLKQCVVERAGGCPENKRQARTASTADSPLGAPRARTRVAGALSACPYGPRHHIQHTCRRCSRQGTAQRARRCPLARARSSAIYTAHTPPRVHAQPRL